MYKLCLCIIPVCIFVYYLLSKCNVEASKVMDIRAYACSAQKSQAQGPAIIFGHVVEYIG
jgi:hypothetical protein